MPFEYSAKIAYTKWARETDTDKGGGEMSMADTIEGLRPIQKIEHKVSGVPLKQFNHTANEKEGGGSGMFLTKAILKFTHARIEVLG